MTDFNEKLPHIALNLTLARFLYTQLVKKVKLNHHGIRHFAK